jgi:hypothetical protein
MMERKEERTDEEEKGLSVFMLLSILCVRLIYNFML